MKGSLFNSVVSNSISGGPHICAVSLQITPAWKFLVILETLISQIRCVWWGLELNCADLWPSRNWVWDQWFNWIDWFMLIIIDEESEWQTGWSSSRRFKWEVEPIKLMSGVFCDWIHRHVNLDWNWLRYVLHTQIQGSSENVITHTHTHTHFVLLLTVKIQGTWWERVRDEQTERYDSPSLHLNPSVLSSDSTWDILSILQLFLSMHCSFSLSLFFFIFLTAFTLALSSHIYFWAVSISICLKSFSLLPHTCMHLPSIVPSLSRLLKFSSIAVSVYL